MVQLGQTARAQLSWRMFLSLGLGVGFALFLEYLDDTVHSTDEVERLLHLPALAVIPSAAASGRRRLLAASRRIAKAKWLPFGQCRVADEC